jgi:two-component system chemotaxis response regulator CheB
MSSQQISVLVVDDSALMRNLVGRIVESADDLHLAGKAMNGKFALSKIPNLNPDVIILDLEMPEMNGVEFLHEYQAQLMEMPVIVLSAVAKKGAKITMDALAHGAVDFIMKPQGSAPDEVRTIAEQLIDLIRLYGNKYRIRKGLAPGNTQRTACGGGGYRRSQGCISSELPAEHRPGSDPAEHQRSTEADNSEGKTRTPGDHRHRHLHRRAPTPCASCSPKSIRSSRPRFWWCSICLRASPRNSPGAWTGSARWK